MTLHEPARHEPLRAQPWDETRARRTIARVVHDAGAQFAAAGWWRPHPKDLEPGDDPQAPSFSFYWGAAGVLWALDYLHRVGAAALPQALEPFDAWLDDALERNHPALASRPADSAASYLMGETPLLMLAQGRAPSTARADRLAALIEGNLDHPARELMWGAPGTMLAALFLHQRFGAKDARWAALFRRSAARLHAQLQWSGAHGCHYWTQDLYGRTSTYLDAVHGFVATACVLIKGRHLLEPGEWDAWQQIIVTTVERTALREHGRANWPAWLLSPPGTTAPLLMQFCHGAPGFVICLAGMPPGTPLDALLLEAGEATWQAGPLTKGSNLCHGTGGNGYALLALFRRTGDARWLDRARAFAMHGIEQLEADARACGELRCSLWTGDPGFAIYLWDCVRAPSVPAAFPALDVFYA